MMHGPMYVRFTFEYCLKLCVKFSSYLKEQNFFFVFKDHLLTLGKLINVLWWETTKTVWKIAKVLNATDGGTASDRWTLKVLIII